MWGFSFIFQILDTKSGYVIKAPDGTHKRNASTALHGQASALALSLKRKERYHVPPWGDTTAMATQSVANHDSTGLNVW